MQPSNTGADMKSLAAIFFSFTAAYAAADVTVPIHAVSDKGVGDKIGQVTLSESTHGVQFKPDLRNLTPGVHGFHVHENPDCGPKEKNGKMAAAEAAGNHYDPQKAGKHGAPWGDGHMGDLPALYISSSGTTTQPVMAPRLTLKDLTDRALVIHAGGDNYSDYPEPLGGGGERVACGVIPKETVE